MYQLLITACAIAVVFCVTTLNLQTRAQTGPSPHQTVAKLIDPGFESFKLARDPLHGWFSDDVATPNDQRMGVVSMTPDDKVKVEGRYSLRIEQLQPRPRNWGQAYLCQTVRLPKRDGERNFNFTMQKRGSLNGPLMIDIYVWEPGYIARPIARLHADVTMQWSSTTLPFKVPNGYDRFGIWIYLPRDNEAELWVDDVRLEAESK